MLNPLTFKMLSKTVTDDISIFHFSHKIRQDVSCESSASQMILLKCQVLYSLKNTKKIHVSDAAVINNISRLNVPWSLYLSRAVFT